MREDLLTAPGLMPVNSSDIDWVRERLAWQDLRPWWLYNTTSQPNKELNNLESLVYAANMVGGGSAINGMQSVRGNTEDYDRWASFFGDRGSGWAWENFLPYFKKALHFQNPSETALSMMPGYQHDPSYWGQLRNTTQVYNGWPEFQWPGIRKQCARPQKRKSESFWSMWKVCSQICTSCTEYGIEAYRAVPGVEFPSDSGAAQSGIFWHPTFSKRGEPNCCAGLGSSYFETN